jgi:hypothetical protein
MDSSFNGGRTYDEKEIARLIERASEIQAKAEGSEERSLSLEEVGQIAADLGLSALSLQEAALELESAPVSDTPSLMGAGPVTQSRVAEGVFRDEDWGKLLLEIQRASGLTGEISQVGTARVWSHSLGEGPGGLNLRATSVTVTPALDHTTIQVREEYDGAALAYGLSFFFASLATLMVAHSIPDVSKLAELAIAGSGGLASLGLTRALIVAGVNRQKEKLSKMADRLAQIVSREEKAAAAVATAHTTDAPVGVMEIDGTREPESPGTADRSRLRT